jgi:F420-dependent oxidoreductase-like protein
MTEVCIFTEPQQGASYDDLLAVAITAEELGYTGFFRSDHFLKMGSVDGLPGPTDAWVTLGALARETSRIRLGTLVTSATFRLPGPLAVAVAQVDQMSGGRVDFGLGAGWFEAEHRAYGIPFPDTRERFERLAEQLEIITGLWRTEPHRRFTFEGKHYQLVDSPALPKPVQRPAPPVIVGGGGRRKTANLVARFAQEYNRAFVSASSVKASFDNVRVNCESIGRDPSTLRYSAAVVLCCGEDDAAVARRAGAIGRDPAELRDNGAAGTPAEVVDKLRSYVDVGAQRLYLQVLDLADLDHLRLVAAEVVPHLS